MKTASSRQSKTLNYTDTMIKKPYDTTPGRIDVVFIGYNDYGRFEADLRAGNCCIASVQATSEELVMANAKKLADGWNSLTEAPRFDLGAL